MAERSLSFRTLRLAPFFFRSSFFFLRSFLLFPTPPISCPKSPQPLEKLMLKLGDRVGVEDQVFLQAVGGDVEGGQGGDWEVGILVGPGEGIGGGLKFGVGDRVGPNFIAGAFQFVEHQAGGEGVASY